MEGIRNIAQTLIIALVVCVFAVCCYEAFGNDDIPEPILLDATDSGGSIHVSVGQELQISLQTIGPGRYGVPEITSSTVQFIGEGDAGLQNPGGPKQMFRFRGVEAGETELRIPHQNGIRETGPFTLRIAVYDGEIPEDEGAISYAGPVIEIDPTHQACKIDSDCVTVMTHCSCDCGVSIHEQYQQTYRDKRDEACSEYDGIMCEMRCEEVPACIEHKCVLEEPE